MKETETIEFKKMFGNDLNKEVIAFANTNGGEIYIGLNDDGSVEGLSNISSMFNGDYFTIFNLVNVIKRFTYEFT